MSKIKTLIMMGLLILLIPIVFGVTLYRSEVYDYTGKHIRSKVNYSLLDADKITTKNITVDGNAVADDFLLTSGGSCCGGSGDNASWNESYANTLYDPLGSVGSSGNHSLFLNKTITTHTGTLVNGSLVGYSAGDEICNLEFSGSHLCNFAEIDLTRSTTDVTINDAWVDNTIAWVSTGPAKYAPADLPVNDCNARTHGAAGSYLGNWWQFNKTSGGAGKTGHCGNVMPLACCK